MTTLGTTQKWSFWTGGSLIKYLDKTTTKDLGRFLVILVIPTVNVL